MSEVNSELLKKAILDAKAVRATSLANARQVLEEAFTPRFQAVVAEKLREDTEADAPIETNTPAAPAPMEETVAPENAKPSKSDGTKDWSSKNSGGFTPTAKNMTPNTVPGPKDGGDGTKSLEKKQKGDIENTPKGIKENSEEVSETNANESIESVEETVTNEDLNEIIEELQAEIAQDNPEDPTVNAPTEPAPAPAPVDPNAIPPVDPMATDPNADPNAIPPVDPNAVPAPVNPVAQAPGVSAPVAPTAPVDPNAVPSPEQTEDEEINLEELLATVNEGKEDDKEDKDDKKKDKEDKEEDDKDKMEESASFKSLQAENKSLKSELNEAISTVKFLRENNNEINLLNAKLLYTNKLFKEFPLNKNQKMKIVESFDLTKNVREVKLMYATMSDTLNFSEKPVKRSSPAVSSITEGLASKPVASTKPAQVINENVNLLQARFQQLAGIKINKPNKQ